MDFNFKDKLRERRNVINLNLPKKDSNISTFTNTNKGFLLLRICLNIYFHDNMSKSNLHLF